MLSAILLAVSAASPSGSAVLRIIENPETGAITNMTVSGDATAMNWEHAADRGRRGCRARQHDV